jgi:diadenosine tetraphosphate (Ap4A) HIT family hydrolase
MACEVLEGRLEAPGGTILREGGWVLHHSVSPCVLRGWLILKPERHVEHVAELTDEESAALGPLIQKASRALMAALGAERVYVMSMGEVVRHVHIYLVPRYADMPQHGLRVLSEMFSLRSVPGCVVMRRRRRQQRQYGASLPGARSRAQLFGAALSMGRWAGPVFRNDP